jgi:intracellular multiplication protein IcmW
MIMPDLSHKAVHAYWKDYDDPTIYKVISFMEGTEDWTLDGYPDLESVISQLGEALEDVGNVELEQEAAVVSAVAHLKTGRGLRILMCFDMACPGAASKILMEAENTTQGDHDVAGLFLRRNIVFERLRLLSRVFAPDRFKLIQKALEVA